MAIEIRVPTLGESISEATVGKWYKKSGDKVEIDEPIVELETDKVTIEVPSPVTGTLSDIIIVQGQDVQVGAIIGMIAEETSSATITRLHTDLSHTITSQQPLRSAITHNPLHLTDEITNTLATKSQITKPKIEKRLAHRLQTIPSPAQSKVQTQAHNIAPLSKVLSEVQAPTVRDESEKETRIPMSRLRRTIASRLLDVQQNTAMLTTFNEVDMFNVMALRKTYKEAFFEKHGIKLGIMSFFVKALTQALQDFPTLNAEIDGNDLIYKDYYHIGVAVSTDKGLVVPVLKDANQMSFQTIEKNIVELAQKARTGHLDIEELQGGTFSLTNGGIYGSLMSTPILNAPQSGILGMHQIQDRPIALNGEVVIRPMMYIALTYDHRIVDGKDAVSFQVRIKESLENPEKLFLDL